MYILNFIRSTVKTEKFRSIRIMIIYDCVKMVLAKRLANFDNI